MIEDLFPPEQRPYTAKELQLAAEREVKIRQRVYPNRVMTHRMSQYEADHQLAMMRQIAEEYRLRAEQDQQEERRQ
jgi:hypothetical protein